MVGQYQPAAIRVVPIPNANGGMRTLGILTLQDYLIQQAIYQTLRAELRLSPQSKRPRRGQRYPCAHHPRQKLGG